MNSDRIEKIKILIQTSPVLNKQEREDWMNLIELMNQNQVLELEKILSYKPASPAPVSENSSAPVSLSHIMNFPTNIPAAPAPKKPPVAPVAPKPAAAAPSSRFSKWLDAQLAEKDLPVGKPEEVAPSKPTPPVKKAEPVVIIEHEQTPPEKEEAPPEEKQIVSLPEKNVPETMTPEKFAAAGFEKARMPVSVTGAAVATKQQSDFRRSGLLNFPQNFSEASAGMQNAGAEKKPEEAATKKPSVPSSGTAAPAPAAASKTQILSQQPKAAAKAPHPLGNQKITPVKELGVLSGLTLAQYRSGGSQAFGVTLGGGIKGFGYHKAIQALEQSPLYSTYIDTGLKLLSEGKSFEDLSGGEPDTQNKYFTRAEFEKFTDLLREVPTIV